MEQTTKEGSRMMMPQRAAAFGVQIHSATAPAGQQQKSCAISQDLIAQALRREQAARAFASSIPIQSNSATTRGDHQAIYDYRDRLAGAPTWMLATTYPYESSEEDDTDMPDLVQEHEPHLINSHSKSSDDGYSDNPPLYGWPFVTPEHRSFFFNDHSGAPDDDDSNMPDLYDETQMMNEQAVQHTPSNNIGTIPRWFFRANPASPDSEASLVTSSESSSEDGEDDDLRNHIFPDNAWEMPLTIALEIDRQRRATPQEDEVDRYSSSDESSEEEDEDDDEDPGYLADIGTESSDDDFDSDSDTEDDWESDDSDDGDQSPDNGNVGDSHDTDSGYDSSRTHINSEDDSVTETEGTQDHGCNNNHNYAQKFSSLCPAEGLLLDEIEVSWDAMEQCGQHMAQEHQIRSSSIVIREMSCFNAMIAKNERADDQPCLPPQPTTRPRVVAFSKPNPRVVKAPKRLGSFYEPKAIPKTPKPQIHYFPEDKDCAICDSDDEDLERDEFILPRRKTPTHHFIRAPIPCPQLPKQVATPNGLYASGPGLEASLVANARRDQTGGVNNFGYMDKRISAEESKRMNAGFVEYAEGCAKF